MPALFVFLLKVNLALIAFCLGYYLVLRKLTFYTLNRVYLMLGIIFSSVYPFINIDDFMQRHQQLAPIRQAVANLKAPAEKLLTYAWYWNWAAFIFWVGAAVFAMRLVVQFMSLYKIYKDSEPANLEQYDVRITDANVSPFSFWQSIFINPDKIDAADLKSILQHEQVHVSEWHTLDILLAEISVIFYWFNPGIWLMKRAVSENVEFITDRKILQQGTDSKAYQYSLLHVSMGVNASPDITNHFNFSTLKKRIHMMNMRRSSSINLSRYALLVPVVVICLCVFSISKANIVHTGKVAYDAISDRIIQWQRPIAEITVKGKRNKAHQFLVVSDTIQKPQVSANFPIILQFKSDSIARGHQTFEIRKSADGNITWAVNGQPVSAVEFAARRPHVKMDTVNIIADYDDIHKPRNTFFAVRLKDNPGSKVDNKATPQDEAIDGKPIESIRTVENVVLIPPPPKDTVGNHAGTPTRGFTITGKTVTGIRLNGKNISKDDFRKLPTAMLAKVTVIDDNAADKGVKNNARPAGERGIDIQSISKIKLDGKEMSKDELDKIPSSLLEKIHVYDSRKTPNDSAKDDNTQKDKRTWNIEMTTKKTQQ